MEKTDKSENKKAAVIAVAIMLGGYIGWELSKMKSYPEEKDIPTDLRRSAEKVVENSPLLKAEIEKADEAGTKLRSNQITRHISAIPLTRILKNLEDSVTDKVLAAYKGYKDIGTWFKIENPLDERTCKTCRKWTGKIVSSVDKSFPSIEDWILDGGQHPNCRCSLVMVTPKLAWLKKKGRELLDWVRRWAF